MLHNYFTTHVQTSEVWQQIRLLQVVSILTSDWVKLCWSHAINGS